MRRDGMGREMVGRKRGGEMGWGREGRRKDGEIG